MRGNRERDNAWAGVASRLVSQSSVAHRGRFPVPCSLFPVPFFSPSPLTLLVSSRMRLSAVVLLALAACTTAPSTTAPAFGAAERAATVDSVQAMLDAWRGAVGTMDVERIASFYATDSAFRWIEDGATRYLSAQQIGDAIRETKGSMQSMELTLVEPQITPLAPGVAVVSTGFTQKFTDTAGVTGGFAGVITMTVVRADSGWRFLVGHTSAIAPRPAPGPRPTSR